MASVGVVISNGLYFVGGQEISLLFFPIKGFAFSCSLGF